MSERADNAGSAEKPSGSWSSPAGLDLNPRPPQAVRISRRTSLALVGVALVLLSLFAYGAWQRRQRQVAELSDANLSKSVAPATAAAADIVKDLPGGRMAGRSGSGIPNGIGQLQAPEDVPGFGSNPSNLYARQASPAPAAYVAPQVQPVHQPSPEEQRLQAAYESEQRAFAASTGLREGFAGSGAGPTAISTGDHGDSATQPSNEHALEIRSTADPKLNAATLSDKETFLKRARNAQPDDYLKSTRTGPLTQYEIKAGWEIPAVMEQGLNSDLPGELKALITSNVYDTATGHYLLIPQGARLVGEYNSQLGYGQNGVQVVWNRVIYPDGSSLDLSGMVGQDSEGLSGFRDKVDHHYKRLIGFAVLSSLFSAASQVSQTQNRSVLNYPSPGEVAGSAVGQQASDLGAQITRKNLNIQPTVKISVGYRFNVRVNRDVLFDAPYEPLS